jgi:hypothetical protein
VAAALSWQLAPAVVQIKSAGIEKALHHPLLDDIDLIGNRMIAIYRKQ